MSPGAHLKTEEAWPGWNELKHVFLAPLWAEVDAIRLHVSHEFAGGRFLEGKINANVPPAAGGITNCVGQMVFARFRSSRTKDGCCAVEPAPPQHGIPAAGRRLEICSGLHDVATQRGPEPHCNVLSDSGWVFVGAVRRLRRAATFRDAKPSGGDLVVTRMVRGE